MKIRTFIVIALMLAVAHVALAENIKLPYEKGQSFVVVQGYNSPPTHIKKDLYAMDLSQNGCDAYGKTAVAAEAGKVMLAQATGYNGGYGTQVLIKDSGDIVARYAHMIPGTIPASLGLGAAVAQGEPLGEIGNTGLVAGAACPTHPGTHIHFAMYGENADGSFAPYLAEPISGYVGITPGQWYLSDNAIPVENVTTLSGIIEEFANGLFGVGESGESTPPTKNNTSSPAAIAISTTTPSLFPAPSPAPAVPEPSPTKQVVVASNSFSLDADASTATASSGPVVSGISSSSSQSLALASSSITATSSVKIEAGGGSSAPVQSGGVSVSPSPVVNLPNSDALASSSVPDASSTEQNPTTVIFNSSTLSIDLSWSPVQNASGTVSYSLYKTGPTANGSTTTATSASGTAPIAVTTSTNFSYPLADNDFGATDTFEVQAIDSAGDESTLPVATATVPNWLDAIQPLDTDNSNGSWYDDNWYDLGTGFYGTIKSLTFEGFIDNANYFASHLSLGEYLDPGYTQLNQGFTISDNAPFTNGLKKITISGLNIPLQPNKYYRLNTIQDYQNRSVILAGTSATGTAMWDEYIYGVGGVQHQYQFYPYLSAVIIPDYPPLQPPNPPGTGAISFDSLNSRINFLWRAATDPDTASNLLTYEVQVTTSTAFDPTRWISLGKTFSAGAAVAFGNQYMIGIRAVDDFGAVSQPLVETWNFPAGYAPVPEQLDHSAQLPGGAQKITLVATTTISSIALWTVAIPNGEYCCGETLVSFHPDVNGNIGDAVLGSSGVVEVHAGISQGPSAEETYTFSPSLTLSPGAYWLSLDNAPVQALVGTEAFGSPGDSYPDGQWSDAPGQDAYFKIGQDFGP